MTLVRREGSRQIIAPTDAPESSDLLFKIMFGVESLQSLCRLSPVFYVCCLNLNGTQQRERVNMLVSGKSERKRYCIARVKIIRGKAKGAKLLLQQYFSNSGSLSLRCI